MLQVEIHLHLVKYIIVFEKVLDIFIYVLLLVLRCNEGSVYFHQTEKCYILRTTKKSWSTARTNCQEKLGRDGDLASIPNEATAQFIMKNFKLSTARVWLGGQRTASGPWTWSDGSKWSYENWYPGQPNEVESGGASTYLSPDNQEDQRWFDATESPDDYFSICQYTIL